jgi:hypothetical protein
MRFVGIVASSLVSGSYYNVGGASDIEALKTSMSKCHSVRTSHRTLRDWSKNSFLYSEVCKPPPPSVSGHQIRLVVGKFVLVVFKFLCRLRLIALDSTVGNCC